MNFRGKFNKAFHRACRLMEDVTVGRLIRERSFDEIEKSIFGSPKMPEDIAAIALSELCEWDGTMVDPTICLAIIMFLDDAVCRPGWDEDFSERLEGLRACGRDVGRIRQWIAEWYPTD